jgi:hypothetical protein
MAYLKPNQTVFIANHGSPIYSNIEKVAFRKYWGKRKDKNTGKYVKARRSMPYAICKVQLSSDPAIPVGSEFTIAGYQLCNVVIKGEKILTFDTKYVAEFADQHGNEWVRKLIIEEYSKEKKDDS